MTGTSKEYIVKYVYTYMTCNISLCIVTVLICLVPWQSYAKIRIIMFELKIKERGYSFYWSRLNKCQYFNFLINMLTQLLYRIWIVSLTLWNILMWICIELITYGVQSFGLIRLSNRLFNRSGCNFELFIRDKICESVTFYSLEIVTSTYTLYEI